MNARLSVILPTHNPHRARLERTLGGLAAQSLPTDQWELVVVDNASNPALTRVAFRRPGIGEVRVIRELKLGLSAARRRGFAEANGNIFVLVDDDNVLAPDYLDEVVRFLGAHPRVGAVGGRSVPLFDQPPPDWVREFFPLLALRDLGDEPLISDGLRPSNTPQNEYPTHAAPIGAGMALRRAAAEQWLMISPMLQLSDRRGPELSSGGDNDIVLTILRAGWEVAYDPELALAHLIPASRLQPGYLARLNRGIQKSWMQVLARHDANPWPPIPRWTVPLRKMKAWFSHRAWSDPAARVRWQGACGHFEGRAAWNDSL